MITNVYDSNLYPPHLQPIADAILNRDQTISDGIGYYATVEDITELAQEIFDLCRPSNPFIIQREDGDVYQLILDEGERPLVVIHTCDGEQQPYNCEYRRK